MIDPIQILSLHHRIAPSQKCLGMRSEDRVNQSTQPRRDFLPSYAPRIYILRSPRLERTRYERPQDCSTESQPPESLRPWLLADAFQNQIRSDRRKFGDAEALAQDAFSSHAQSRLMSRIDCISSIRQDAFRSLTPKVTSSISGRRHRPRMVGQPDSPSSRSKAIRLHKVF